MPREVSYPYLRAAAEAFPFTSEPAYRRCTLHLARSRHLLHDPSTAGLARDLEEWLRPRAAGRSLDEIRRLTELAWFDDAPDHRPLADVLTDLACRTLQSGGDTIHLQRDHDLPERYAHYRWLSLLLPADLLIAAFSPHPPTDHVSLLTPQLAELLTERPVAETHAHLNAAMSFGVVWTGIAAGLAHQAPQPSELPRSNGPVPLGDADLYLSTLCAAFIARLLLARHLRRCELGVPPSGGFAETLRADVPTLAAHFDWPRGRTDAAAALQSAVGLVVNGRRPPPLTYPRLLLLHRLLLGPTSPTPASGLAALVARDPLSAWLPTRAGGALPETHFAARAIAHLRGPGRDDDAFAKVFWQYQRVRGLTYRYLVHESGTAGLDWFQEHFLRARPFRAPLERCRLEAALAYATPGVQLGSYEARISPSATAAELVSEVRDLIAEGRRARTDPRWAPPELGILVHFLKERSRSGAPILHADPRQPLHGVRYGAWGYARLREALAIEAALRDRPRLLVHFRGLDVASAELAVPTWAVAPSFLRARRASVRASERLARRGVLGIPPLRATCHAGEDYLRLVEGLRRVHETLETGMLDAGDRIGHGFVLGVDPERWARGSVVVAQTREDRLDDLLWELDRYGCGDIAVDSGRYAFARAEVRRLGRRIYGEEHDADTLVEARRLRHDPRYLERFGFPFRRAIPPREGDGAERALVDYLTGVGVFRRGQVVEEVRATDAEVGFLRAAQAWLRAEFARLEITVESNPSSNLLIGDLLSVEEHPSFQMQPLPGRAVGGEVPVLLSINTDDPLTFATSPADEVAHLYGALLRSRVPASDALAWLAARRDQGHRSRFTLPQSRAERSPTR